jgi:hypothetical protein
MNHYQCQACRCWPHARECAEGKRQEERVERIRKGEKP